jgi:hypothetical protein
MLSGCFNERGVSMRYYNDCEEYYDAQGYYHKKCDTNTVDYSEIRGSYQNLKNTFSSESSPNELGKVW